MDIDLTEYDLILVSISGGKDSQATLLQTISAAKQQGVSHRVLACHCDTDAEWPQTQNVVKDLCYRLTVQLKIVTPIISIPDYIEKRGKFPSMQCRFCTSQKTSAIDKLIRALFPAKQGRKILSVTGERREESTYRSKLSKLAPHRLTAGNRQVFHYRPIIDWNVEKVWKIIRYSGIPPHPAYTEYDNDRLSCALCVFASEKDIRNGAIVRPDIAARYLEVEEKTGFTFRHKQSLKKILNQGV